MPKFEVTLARAVVDLEVTKVVVDAADEAAAAVAAQELIEPPDPPEDWLGWRDWQGEERLECEDAQVDAIAPVPDSTPLTTA